MALRQVEQYWKTRIELVSALKEGATSSSMADSDVKTEVSEGVYVVDVKGGSLDWPKAKSYASTTVSMSSPVLPLSRYAYATQAAIASSGAPPYFESLWAFELHLHEEYGGLHRDQMQRIQDFRR